MSDQTLLVNGTDLQGLTGVVITDPHCLRATGARRNGSSDSSPGEPIPGRPGQLGADLPIDAFPFTVPVAINGSDIGHLEANIAALGAALGASAGVGGLVTLERHVPKVGGGHDTHTAAGFFGGFSNWGSPGATDALVDLLFVNLDGRWTSDSGTTWLVP